VRVPDGRAGVRGDDAGMNSHVTNAPTLGLTPRLVSVPLEIERVRERLEAGSGGYEVVHSSPGLEIGVYVLVAPEPDRQQPHEVDEVYYVLEGRGALEIEGETVELQHGQAQFVAAGAEHRFTGYEQMSVLVIFAGQSNLANAHDPASN
jgi:mannose-6-phosphate isomerase-like protein (cupin superfamily)